MATKVLSMIIGVAGLIAIASPAGAQEKLRLAWAGFSPTNSPIWVIEEKKLLQRQGVTPEIIAINASPTVLQALLADEIDAASISVTTLTSSRLQGADTVMIVGVVPTFVDHIVSLGSITKIEQLKGKTAGVNRLGSTSDLGLRLALKKLGIDPEKDVKIIPTGGTAERFAALSKGVTQFTIIPEPFLTQAEKLGFRNLYNVTDLKIPFWWNGIMSRDAIVKAKRPLMLKLTGTAGKQDSSCWPFTRIEVMLFNAEAVLMVIRPRALTVPAEVELTVMALPFSAVPTAMEVTMTFAPLCEAT